MTEEYPGHINKSVNNKAEAGYEGILWDKASEISDLKKPLETLLQEKFDLVERLRSGPLSPGKQEELADAENDYWRIMEKFRALQDAENRVQECLSLNEKGQLSVHQMEEFMPPPPQEEPELSKKKRAMLAEAQKLGLDTAEARWDVYDRFYLKRLQHGSDPYRLTSGRHIKGIAGRSQHGFSPFKAADTFFYYSTDTHGGKVEAGKRPYRIAPGGRRIRK